MIVLITNGAIGVRAKTVGVMAGEPGVAVGEERLVVLGFDDHLEVEVAPPVGRAGTDRSSGADRSSPAGRR